MSRTIVSALAGVCLLWAGPAVAQDFLQDVQQEVHGRILLQDVGAFEDTHSVDAYLGYRNRNDVLGDVRLTWEPSWQHWNFGFAYELNTDYGDNEALTTRLTSILGMFVKAPPTNWWDLSNTFVHDTRFMATQRLDRLWFGYTGSHLVIRLGRQALTWGSGLVFHPMDLFNPFAPNATDTEYKLGSDMAYAQWLFDDGSDLQLVVVPRPLRKIGGALTSNTTSYAAHLHTAIGPFQTTWLLARDRRDWMAGVGVNGALGGATWNAEVIPTFVHDGSTYTSGIFNISDATTVFDRDVTVFSEYYRNGFGLADRRYAVLGLPAPLLNRLLRGQVFDTGRDYLAVGAIAHCTPLLEVNPTLIANLDDGGFFGIVQATYSLRENLNLVVGGQFQVAPSNTEFGGLPLIENFPIFIEQPRQVYVQLRQYF